jgi:hypothetical protein
MNLKLRTADVLCHNCGETLYGGPADETTCFCGNITITGARVNSTGGIKIDAIDGAEYTVTHMQWIDNSHLVAEGSPKEISKSHPELMGYGLMKI